jgi:hypothetical protein
MQTRETKLQELLGGFMLLRTRLGQKSCRRIATLGQVLQRDGLCIVRGGGKGYGHGGGGK